MSEGSFKAVCLALSRARHVAHDLALDPLKRLGHARQGSQQSVLQIPQMLRERADGRVRVLNRCLDRRLITRLVLEELSELGIVARYRLMDLLGRNQA